MVSWNVPHLLKNDPSLRRANKVVAGEKYWFFRHMPYSSSVKVLGIPSFLEETPASRLGLHNILQTLQILGGLKNYDIILSHHTGSGFFFSLFRKIFNINNPPHVIIDVGLSSYANSPEKLENWSNMYFQR